MEPALPTSDDARRARRVARIVRLAFYPLAALLAAVLLLGRDEAAGKPVTTKYGATTQGRAFELGLDADGRPGAFSTEVSASCPDGTQIAMPWDPSDGDPVPFERDGDRLRVAERGDGWELALDARVGERGGLRGTVSLVVHVKPERRAAFECRSPGVRFSAGG